jgi:hypothetical protein
LTWSLYEQFNEWFIALDNDHGVFAAAFSKAMIEGAWSNTHNIIGKFRFIVSMVCKKYKQIILNNFGFDIKDIGVHSWRKLVHLQESSNGIVSTATAVYTGAAACIRGGHSKGKKFSISLHTSIPIRRSVAVNESAASADAYSLVRTRKNRAASFVQSAFGPSPRRGAK